jgi:hypothetical protein
MKKINYLWGIVLAPLLLILLINITAKGNDQLQMLISDIASTVYAVFAFVGIFLAFRSLKVFDYAKIAWLIMLVGIALNVIAEATYGYLEVFSGEDMNSYFPSTADYSWCIAYLFFFGSMLMMILGYKNSGFPMGKAKVYWLIITGFLVLTIVMTLSLLVPILTDTETDAKSKAIYLIYPIGDIVVVSLAAIIMYVISLFGKAAIARPWQFIGFGFVLFAISDLLYSYFSWNDAYSSGNIIDIGWYLGYIFIGFAGIYQKKMMDSFKEI